MVRSRHMVSYFHMHSDHTNNLVLVIVIDSIEEDIICLLIIIQKIEKNYYCINLVGEGDLYT